MQHTPSEAARSRLFATFLGLLLEYQATFKQERTFHRMLALVFGVLWSLGRPFTGCFVGSASSFRPCSGAAPAVPPPRRSRAAPHARR
jgi:hypothetical protein